MWLMWLMWGAFGSSCSMWRRLTLSLSSVYLSRSVRLQNSKLASLQLLLLLFLITFVLFKALQGALYEQLRAEHWIIGDLQALTRPREGLQNDAGTEKVYKKY